MARRPLVLMGSERAQATELVAQTADCRFDGRLGFWRDRRGNMAVRAATPITLVTNTREGVDPSGPSALSTRVTKTLEGIDQVETTGR